jgi:hypothetical protein
LSTSLSTMKMTAIKMRTTMTIDLTCLPNVYLFLGSPAQCALHSKFFLERPIL